MVQDLCRYLIALGVTIVLGLVFLDRWRGFPDCLGHLHVDAAHERHAVFSVLLDAEGTAGKEYGAKTTPHIFIIDPQGTLIYAGGIDDIASTDIDDIARAHSYVREALDAAMAGKPVQVSVSRSYGCSVKYAD